MKQGTLRGYEDNGFWLRRIRHPLLKLNFNLEIELQQWVTNAAAGRRVQQ